MPAAAYAAREDLPGNLAVSGDIDEASCDSLRDSISDLSQGYTRSITVNLSLVDFLPSMAIGVLAEATGKAAAAGASIELVAAAGTIAQRVLTVCAMPHRTS